MGLVRQVSPSLAFLHDLLLADDETSAGEVDANSSIYKFLNSIYFETCLRARGFADLVIFLSLLFSCCVYVVRCVTSTCHVA